MNQSTPFPDLGFRKGNMTKESCFLALLKAPGIKALTTSPALLSLPG
jgi:hypothetical protein